MTQQNNIIQQKLDEYFKRAETSDERVFYQLMLYVFSVESKQQNDLHLIAKILPIEHTMNLVNYFSGDTVKFPTKDQLYSAYLTAICYYLKCIKGKSWSEIKDFLNLPERDKDLISSISLGYKINALNDTMSRDLKDILKKFKVDNIDDLIESLKRGIGESNESR